MSDKMTPVPFADLMRWILEEKETKGTVFGVQRAYKAESNHSWALFGGKIEMPLGPAKSGPHTQLAQNPIAAYYGQPLF